ncbi:uncharacterized protein LOC133204007 [Saccostrea echinata]|uniref:uncharacterized protein LOC133204007 n=1 Tax=Saccostrea echinata TaxID=191078 RepID=UPI002A80ECC3|nr:uncharacterized protein LOC133204007 [Saccostrea echinata]
MFLQAPGLDQWTVERKMGKSTYQIISIQKSFDNKFVYYSTMIRAPKNTEMETYEGGLFSNWRKNSKWELVSNNSHADTALYKASLKGTPNTFLIPPVWLKSESESFRMQYAPFATIEMQTNFKFNDCQFQVEKQESQIATLYKITVRTCNCRRKFEGSVGKMTLNGFEETAGLSALYFFPVHMFEGFSSDDQISSIFINRTALINDGVDVKSLKFSIEREQDDLDKDMVDESKLYYKLI